MREKQEHSRMNRMAVTFQPRPTKESTRMRINIKPPFTPFIYTSLIYNAINAKEKKNIYIY